MNTFRKSEALQSVLARRDAPSLARGWPQWAFACLRLLCLLGAALPAGARAETPANAILIGYGNDGPFKSDGSGLTANAVYAFGHNNFTVEFGGALYTPQLELLPGSHAPPDPLPFTTSWLGAAEWQSGIDRNAFGLGGYAGASGAHLGGSQIQGAFHQMMGVGRANWDANPRRFEPLFGLNGWFSRELAAGAFLDRRVGLAMTGQAAAGPHVALARLDLGITIQRPEDGDLRLPNPDGLNGFVGRDALARGNGLSASLFVKKERADPDFCGSKIGLGIHLAHYVAGVRAGAQVDLIAGFVMRVEVEVATPYYAESQKPGGRQLDKYARVALVKTW